MIEFIARPWPWWIAGPLMGLVVALLLAVDNRALGVSSSLRHLCAATVPGQNSFLKYDWRRIGGWNLLFVLGIFLGGALSAAYLYPESGPALAEATQSDLSALGLQVEGYLPLEVYSLKALQTATGWWVLGLGGFLVGFGARYAGGCTSGHAITGLASFQLPSLVAVVSFFAGGMLSTYVLLPWILGGAS